jgi:DNA-binding HxlR family transcriptional regulator
MPPKDSAATALLLSLLESRYAMRVLWALRDGQAQTFRALQDSVGGVTPNTLNTRLKELKECALLTHTAQGYVLTSLGLDLAKRLGELASFAPRWTTAQGRKPRDGR